MFSHKRGETYIAHARRVDASVIDAEIGFERFDNFCDESDLFTKPSVNFDDHISE
jgi:hypothetical protein